MITIQIDSYSQREWSSFLPFTFLKKTISLLLFSLCFSGIFAQDCTINTDLQTVDAWSTLKTATDFGGSTFIACETGTLSTLTIKVHEASTLQKHATLFLELGIGDATNDGLGTADYQQLVTIAGEGATTTLKLTKPFSVEKGETYTWYLQKDVNAGALIQAATIEPHNTYLEGVTWYNNAMYATMDNVFTVEINADK